MTGKSYTRLLMESQERMRDVKRRTERQELHATTPTASGGPLSSAQPYDVWPTDSNYWPPFPFPTFKDVTEPEGWELVQVHFVNFDKDGKLTKALGKTVKEFITEIREGHGYAFLEGTDILSQIVEYQLKKGPTGQKGGGA